MLGRRLAALEVDRAGGTPPAVVTLMWSDSHGVHVQLYPLPACDPNASSSLPKLFPFLLL